MKKFALVILVFLAPISAHAEADLTIGLDALRDRDYNTAVANLEPLANDGNVEAEYRMCGMYYLGQGVPKNDAEAVRYCHMAAERGHVDAMYNLALMYNKGEGVGQDYNEATKWYAAAAAKGHPDARFNLKQIQLANMPGANPKALELVHNAATNITQANRVRPAEQNIAAPKPAPPAPPVQPVLPVQQQGVLNNPGLPVLQVAPAKPVVPMPREVAQKPVAKPVQLKALVAPPSPPTPPKPPVEIANAIRAKAVPSVVAPDIAKYCLIAAQRGNPDPKCAHEFSPLLSPEKKAAETADLQMPVKAKAPAEVAVVAPPPLEEKNAAEPVYTLAKTKIVVEVAPPASPPRKKPEVVKPYNSIVQNLIFAPSKIDEAEVASVATTSVMLNSPSLPPPETIAMLKDKPKKKPPEHDLNWYVERANTGNPQAQNNLGVMYRRGEEGAPKSIPEAIKWFERAASQGSVNGMLNLASIYKMGEGTDQNLELAYAWYNLAGDRLPRDSEKRQRAQENVKEVAKYLTNEQIGDALQYVTELDENLPVLNEPLDE